MPEPSMAVAAGGVTFALPTGWTVEPELAQQAGVALVALAPARGSFRSNAVVTESAIGELTLGDWEDGTDEVLDRTTAGYLLVDRWMSGTGADATSHRLAAYTTAEGADVTLVQCSRARAGTGVTLSLTVPTEDYPDELDLLERIADSLTWEDA